jgi:hypothetical protein
MKSIIGNKTEATVKQVNFGSNDQRGREVGASIRIYEIDFVPAPENYMSWYNMDAGHYFGLTFHATRNGVGYGPIQPDKYFKTEAERNLAIEKYLAYATKKAKGGK